jgi:hypothetical protein
MKFHPETKVIMSLEPDYSPQVVTAITSLEPLKNKE